MREYQRTLRSSVNATLGGCGEEIRLYELFGVQLTYKDYLIGAQAAQERGDIFSLASA